VARGVVSLIARMTEPGCAVLEAVRRAPDAGSTLSAVCVKRV
jgi:hypothetical protein